MAKRTTYSRKSLAVALGIVGVAGLSMASAAQLTVNSDPVSAGAADVVSCDADGVTVSYSTAWDGTDGQYEVTDIDVTGVAAGCETYTMDITVMDGTTAVIFTDSLTIGATGTESFAGVNVAAENVEDVAVAIF